jgi:hypothetical protein
MAKTPLASLSVFGGSAVETGIVTEPNRDISEQDLSFSWSTASEISLSHGQAVGLALAVSRNIFISKRLKMQFESNAVSTRTEWQSCW